MPNKELDRFYKKLSRNNREKTMSYSNNTITLDYVLDEIDIPEGYEIIDGKIMKDGIISIGSLSYKKIQKEDTPTSILTKLSSVTEDEDYSELDEDEEEYIDEDEDLEDSITNSINENKSDEKISNDNIFESENEKDSTNKSKKRIKRFGQFLSYKFSKKKDYVEISEGNLNNYYTVEQVKAMMKEISEAYIEKINALYDENDSLRELVKNLESEVEKLKKSKTRTRSYKRNTNKTEE